MPLSINLNRLDHQRVHWLGRSGIPGRDGIDARTARNRRVAQRTHPTEIHSSELGLNNCRL
jgi:hypothetical protein